MFTKLLRSKINPADAVEGIHQEILTIAYLDWQAHRDWSMAAMIDNAREQYGELAAFAVLVGKYNQQVTNGGHRQHWDNGYASASSDGFGNRHSDTGLLNQLIDGMEKFGLRDCTEHGKEVYEIMLAYRQRIKEGGDCHNCGGDGGWDCDEWVECSTCDGNGYNDDDECPSCEGDGGVDLREWEDCSACGGDGHDSNEIGYTDDLDTNYYRADEAWMAELEKFFSEKLAA